MKVTRDTLLDALREAAPSGAEDEVPPGAFRIAELSEALGLGREATRRRLETLKQQGLVETFMLRRRYASGIRRVTHYRLKEKP